MPIYWFLFIVSLLLASIVYDRATGRFYLRKRGIEYHQANFMQVMLIFLPTVFLVGMRSEVGDTISYYKGFEQLSTEFSLLNLDERAYGYSILQRFCKAYLFTAPNAWLTLIAIISIIPIAYNLARYSANIRTSIFVFFASTEFTFLLNGARQFIAVNLCFLAFKYIEEKKIVKFYIVVLLATTFHMSALFMLPMYFVVRGKPWSFKMCGVIIVLVLCCYFAENVFTVFNETVLTDTVYDHYATSIFEAGGIKWQRVLVSAIPSLLALYKKKKIEKCECGYIDCCINFSVLGFISYLFAFVLGGNLTARIAEYFSIYNLILYPYLFTYIFMGKERRILKCLFVAFYVLFFIYQMNIAWGGLEYVSEALRIDF